MDGNTAGVFAWFGLLFALALVVLAVWAWVFVALVRPNWLLPLLHRPQAQPQPPARGTGWPPSTTQLMGTFEQAAQAVDPNLTVGELIDAWMDYHYHTGGITVSVPSGQRQLPTDFQPPAPGWRYGEPR